MRTYTLNITDLAGYAEIAATVDVIDGDIASYSKLFAQELAEMDPEISNKGLCVATCDEQGIIQFVVPIASVH